MKRLSLATSFLASAAVALGVVARLQASPGAPPAPPAVSPSPTAAPTAVPPAGPPAPADPLEMLERAQIRAAQEAAEGVDVVTNPQTGRKEQRIAKSPQYYVVRDRLYNAILPSRSSGGGVPLLRQDESYYYVEPPADPSAVPPDKEKETPDESLRYLVELPAQEAEVIAPPESPSPRIRLEDASEGLPTTGMWRENFSLADLDGDGSPEIVTPPPRLSGKSIQIFQRVGSVWRDVQAAWEDPEGIGFEYGGVAAGDIDRDGRVDLVFGRHGGGPAIAFNQGSWRFRVESRGLPRGMSTRSIVLGDLDGDRQLDVMSISDSPEYTEVRRAEGEGDLMARQPRPDGYVPGYDVRAFLNRGARFEEKREGLDGACFGYSMSLVTSPADSGPPFAVTSCRYRFLDRILWEFDRKAQTFRSVGTDVIEAWAYPIGTAAGIYRGKPAVAVSYFKVGPQGGMREISGNGVTLLYRERDAWKRHRVWKTVEQGVSSSGLAMGDLDGDGLDDVVFADDRVSKVRVFFQRKDGSFEELAEPERPSYPNHATAVRLADMDGDRRTDIVVMSQFLTGDATRAGGVKVFRNLAPQKRSSGASGRAAAAPSGVPGKPMVRKHIPEKKP